MGINKDHHKTIKKLARGMMIVPEGTTIPDVYHDVAVISGQLVISAEPNLVGCRECGSFDILTKSTRKTWATFRVGGTYGLAFCPACLRRTSEHLDDIVIEVD